MPPPQRPQRLGPYEIVAKIAGGGMAAVYLGRATNEYGVERVVAVKVIRNDLVAQHDVVAMFLDEARILNRLSHPNVARTYEAGVSEEHEQHFIAMELLLGRTLADVWEALVVARERMAFEMCAWVAARLADGLHHAHELTDEHGAPFHVIHRDVNPTNIFLTYDGEVKLFDFGLAKAQGRLAKSQVGIVKGKLPYLAPEQIMQMALDRRSDIFTLGTTLWEMTTMRRLFKRDDDVETVKAVRSGPIPDGASLVHDYPDELWRIVRRALERNRDHRYATAEALARELDAFVGEARAKDMPERVSHLVDRLFPGERRRQLGWLRQTRSLPPGAPRITQAPAGPLSQPVLAGPTSRKRV